MVNTSSQARAIIWTAVSSPEQAKDDKTSLESQYRAALAVADREGMIVIDHLSVPGHSRAETDILSLFDAYAEMGVWAYHKLRAHWQAGDFDVLLAFHPNRLGRSFSVIAMCLENVVKRGRRAYFVQGGWADESNVSYFLAMAGVATTSETKQRVSLARHGARARVEAGLPARKASFTHRVVRDERGKGLRLELREDMRVVFDLAAGWLLEGASYLIIADRLNEIGVLGPYGGRMASAIVRRMFLHPNTWGVGVRDNGARVYDVWSFNPDIPPPANVTLERNPRNPIPPVWEGDTARLIQAELMRRYFLQKGHANPQAYHLTGLINCADCGRRMVVKWGGSGGRYWGCVHRAVYAERCPNRKSLPDGVAKRQIVAFLRRAAALRWGDLSAGLMGEGGPDHAGERARLEEGLAQADQEIRALISEQSKAPESIRQYYRDQLEGVAARQEALKDALQRLPRADANVHRAAALQDLLSVLDSLWDMPPNQVNRMLLAAMGRHRFVATGGQIVGFK